MNITTSNKNLSESNVNNYQKIVYHPLNSHYLKKYLTLIYYYY